ncbi:hypothetical protein [Mycobacterium simiae]|uniref:hypothetical protein n=1 Tax=Mycobacterium simiae TaxID=1784 RepID=UPI000B2B8B42|nr:hypothetical protein [Mycobacterium simiae]
MTEAKGIVDPNIDGLNRQAYYCVERPGEISRSMQSAPGISPARFEDNPYGVGGL